MLLPRFGDVVVTSVEEALVFVERSPTCQQSISFRAHFYLDVYFHIPSKCPLETVCLRCICIILPDL